MMPPLRQSLPHSMLHRSTPLSTALNAPTVSLTPPANLVTPIFARLSHYLSDKKKHDRSVLEMAGKLTQQLAGGGSSGGGASRAGAAARSDEGLKAVVAAYEQKQTELGKENRDLKAALASLQVWRTAAGGCLRAGGSWMGAVGCWLDCCGLQLKCRPCALVAAMLTRPLPLLCGQERGLCWAAGSNIHPPFAAPPPPPMQTEYKDVLNRQVRQQQADASSSAAAAAAVDEAFLQSECGVCVLGRWGLLCAMRGGIYWRVGRPACCPQAV